MSAPGVDAYLRAVEEPKRHALEALRGTILEVVPGNEHGDVRVSCLERVELGAVG